MRQIPLNSWNALFASLAMLFLSVPGCGPTKTSPPAPPKENESVKTPKGSKEVKPLEKKPDPPVEPDALPPPMLVIPAGPPEPGVKQATAAIPISFDDLRLSLKSGEAFDKSLLTSRAKELVGKQVAIRGYIFSELTTTSLVRFPFLRSAECPFGPGANAEHVIDVQLEGESTTEYTTRPVTVIGVLSAEPYIGDDGTPWAIFRIVARRVQR